MEPRRKRELDRWKKRAYIATCFSTIVSCLPDFVDFLAKIVEWLQ